jgi:hypothetical protein
VALGSNLGLIAKSWRERGPTWDYTPLWYHLAYLGCCVLGLALHPFLHSLLLLDIVAREDTLKNVIRSVTRFLFLFRTFKLKLKKT